MATIRLPLPGSGSRPRDIEIVTSIPFNARGDAGRRHTQRATRGGLWRLLVAAVAMSAGTMMFGAWWWSSQLPESQKRAAESEALLAPPSQSFCSRIRPPMVCAHGGDTTHAPPNTVSAFRNALAAGADCVEIDAAMSKDGVLVVMHVRELAQLLGGSRKGVQVGDLPSSELLALRWPSGEYVMSVEEAVKLTSPFVDVVTLDVKNYNDKSGQPTDELAMAEALVGLVSATRCTNCLIWAKSDRVVRRVLELSPGQRTGYIVMNETEESRQLGMHHPLRFGGPAAAPSPRHLRGQDQAPGAPGSGSGGAPRQPTSVYVQPAVVGVHFAMVEPQLLDVLHGAGKQLYAWTINHAEVLRAVLDVGVDALVTNYPLTAMEAIESRLTKCGGGSRNGGGRIWRPNGTRSSGGGVGDDGPLLPGDYL